MPRPPQSEEVVSHVVERVLDAVVYRIVEDPQYAQRFADQAEHDGDVN